MAWDFATEPEFQEHLDWMRDLVRDEVWPIESVFDALGYEGFKRALAPLQPSPVTGAVRDLLRARGIPGPGPDTSLSPDLETAADAVREGLIAAQLGAHR